MADTGTFLVFVRISDLDTLELKAPDEFEAQVEISIVNDLAWPSLGNGQIELRCIEESFEGISMLVKEVPEIRIQTADIENLKQLRRKFGC